MVNTVKKWPCQKIDHDKIFSTDTLKTASKRAIKKTEGVTGDLIGTKLLIKWQRAHHWIIQIVQIIDDLRLI